jgi:hypothetical protein
MKARLGAARAEIVAAAGMDAYFVARAGAALAGNRAPPAGGGAR